MSLVPIQRPTVVLPTQIPQNTGTTMSGVAGLVNAAANLGAALPGISSTVSGWFTPATPKLSIEIDEAALVKLYREVTGKEPPQGVTPRKIAVALLRSPIPSPRFIDVFLDQEIKGAL